MKFLSKNIKINIVLVIGLALIFAGILLLTGYVAKNPQSIFLFRGVILFILGASFLFVELMNTSKTWLMFISVVLMLILQIYKKNVCIVNSKLTIIHHNISPFSTN